MAVLNNSIKNFQRFSQKEKDRVDGMKRQLLVQLSGGNQDFSNFDMDKVVIVFPSSANSGKWSEVIENLKSVFGSDSILIDETGCTADGIFYITQKTSMFDPTKPFNSSMIEV